MYHIRQTLLLPPLYLWPGLALWPAPTCQVYLLPTHLASAQFIRVYIVKFWCEPYPEAWTSWLSFYRHIWLSYLGLRCCTICIRQANWDSPLQYQFHNYTCGCPKNSAFLRLLLPGCPNRGSGYSLMKVGPSWGKYSTAVWPHAGEWPAAWYPVPKHSK